MLGGQVRMRKAVVVGGSNGIGLAIAKELVARDYYVNIVDLREPEEGILPKDRFAFIKSNLLDFDEELFQKLSGDLHIDFLMITAGFGRVAELENLHLAEVNNVLEVNSVAAIKIIRIFYDRIKNESPFYCGIMGSIAGLVSSPMFSVYAASKASVCRFVESVNIELEEAGCPNRILNVSPGSIKGTKFNGGSNDLTQTHDLAEQIVCRVLDAEDLFIPEYEKTFKGVIEQYTQDPHKYGLHSYEYKLKSGRVQNEKRVRIGYLSGTFDLFHVGHLNLLRRAKEQCDYLIVGVHKDASHKGKETFIPFEERLQIVGSCKYVDKAVQSCTEDSDAWNLWHYTKLFVGSDYKGTERFLRYEKYFEDKDVQIIYFPYTEGTSSTQIRKTIIDKTNGTSK